MNKLVALTIGDGAVVAAVTRSVTPENIVAWFPAKFLAKRYKDE